MLNKVFDALNENGVDVYYIGQHIGVCATPYVVVKNYGENEIPGISLNQNVMDMILFYPVGQFDKVNDFILKIKAALKTVVGLRDARYMSPIIIDEDKKAYTTSIRYTCLSAFIR